LTLQNRTGGAPVGGASPLPICKINASMGAGLARLVRERRMTADLRIHLAGGGSTR
jgi:hypothetical protein